MYWYGYATLGVIFLMILFAVIPTVSKSITKNYESKNSLHKKEIIPPVSYELNGQPLSLKEEKHISNAIDYAKKIIATDLYTVLLNDFKMLLNKEIDSYIMYQKHPINVSSSEKSFANLMSRISHIIIYQSIFYSFDQYCKNFQFTKRVFKNDIYDTSNINSDGLALALSANLSEYTPVWTREITPSKKYTLCLMLKYNQDEIEKLEQMVLKKKPIF